MAAASDMPKLRQALTTLLDESGSITSRFTQAIDSISGLGKGTASAILTVAYPDRYGVWNKASEAGLENLGILPEAEGGMTLGQRYASINDVLARLKRDLQTDFWLLDAMWWYLEPGEEQREALEQSSPNTPITPISPSRVRLEKELEAFLLENWDNTELGKEWDIYSTSDEPEAGNQYRTDVGYIDILAVHKSEPRMLVVELKRDQSSDSAVGQVLRYIGWVKEKLAVYPPRQVEGVIIAQSIDTQTIYALATLGHVKFMSYEVQFTLKPHILQKSTLVQVAAVAQPLASRGRRVDQE